jgi:hypothetical protein
MKSFVIAATLFWAGTLTGATINSGTASVAMHSGPNSFRRLDFEGTTNAGNPYSLDLRDHHPGSLGNGPCHGTGSPVPRSCTWTFSSYTLPLPPGSTAFNQLTWDGITYDLGLGSPYTALITLNVVAPSLTTMSTFSSSGSFHGWSFPDTTGTVTLDLKIMQGLTTLVSESMTSGALIYNARAFEAVDYHNTISYRFGPEPSTFAGAAVALAILLHGVRRRKLSPG